MIEKSFGAWILSLLPEGLGRIEKTIGIIEGRLTYIVVLRHVVIKHLTPLRTVSE